LNDPASREDHFLSIPDLLKAEPREEDGRRFIYLEASKEARDLQGEIVLAKALADSAEYYARYGNLDIQHRSIVGLANGERDYHLHEIGFPVDVQASPQRTFVKGEIFRGSGPTAECANMFWDSVTKLRPAQRWYPSVGGKVLDSDVSFDPVSRRPVTRVKAVRWSNIGFSRTPVNTAVPTVSTIPFGVLAKSWGIGGAGIDLAKSLEAGAGTDSATLAGGGALRRQSLDRRVQSYFDFRNRMSTDIAAKAVGGRASDMIAHACAHYGLDAAESGEHTERFFADLRAGLSKSKRKAT